MTDGTHEVETIVRHEISLDERMKEAGMIPLSELVEKNALGKFSVHAGVTDLNSFEEWLKMRFKEMALPRIGLELDKNTDDEMYEWYMSHMAAFGEVLANFRQATGRKA